MTPYMSRLRRLVAWALWKWERFEDTDSAEFYVIKNPDLLRVTSLLRDYYYVKCTREDR